MKYRNLAIYLCIITILSACHDSRVIELPISEQSGFGPFHPYLGGVSTYSEDEDDPWIKTRLQLKGIPESFSDAKIGDIETNFYQFVYQSYFQGLISEEEYMSTRERLNWIPDTTMLSKQPMKTRIAFVVGKDSEGNTKMVIDANNNLDLSDDSIFSPFELDPNKNQDLDSLAISNSIRISYERKVDDTVTEVTSAIFIGYFPHFNMFMSCFPQFASASYKGNDIAVCSDHFLNMSYMDPFIVLLNDSLKNDKKTSQEQNISKNEYLRIGNKLYKNLGINSNRMVLQLEETTLPESRLVSTQTGFKSPAVEGADFVSGEKVSLDNLKGKYVLLDFWAVWCGPCIGEFPNMKELYEKTKRSDFDIIGVVCNSEVEDLKTIIDENKLPWPLVVSDQTNRIKESYLIKAYPTTLLLDRDGVIIAKNLRGKELEEEVLRLISAND